MFYYKYTKKKKKLFKNPIISYISNMRFNTKKAKRYYVLNQYGEIYSGMKYGKFQYHYDWNHGKPITKQGSTYLKLENPKIELVPENEL